MKYYEDKPQGYYYKVRKEMLNYLPEKAQKVLDIGCGNGAFATLVKEKNNAEVWGIELMEEEAKVALNVLDKVLIGACENHLNELPDGYFEVIYLNDVLEHLVDPYSVLETLKSKLTQNGVVISSIPNVRFFRTFSKVLFSKDWKYEDHGVMDKTHLRFFTGKSIKRMYNELGYTILKHEGINVTKSIKPILFNIPFLFTQMDIRNVQYATVATVK
ncbi:class I SAM-dependent methyltransferase [Flavobacterium sp.]|uniref:class I SAM-dependent methyltransferase n=1 Tax=Flavobacterium sp. TaxID=239 RepID=UPI0025C3B96C|nr:class I SAM-dependent methyltransferase [Flavobacterium sp.]